MAKGKAEETALAVRSQVSEALAVAEGADRSDRRGKENITRDDLTLPRLAVAQKTSPQLEPDKAEYIDGLKLYQMFNTVTGEIYGNGPLEFVIVRGPDKRAMEFDKDNKVVDFDVPWNDPRCEFTVAEQDSSDGKIKKGDRVKPQATRFYEYVIVLVATMEIAVLSLKSTQVKVAKKLNNFISLRPGAAWLGKYKITSRSETKGAFTYANFLIAPAGATDAALAKFAEEVYENIKGVSIRTEREGDGDTEFNTDEM